MSGTGLQLTKGCGEDRYHKERGRAHQKYRGDQLLRGAQSDVLASSEAAAAPPLAEEKNPVDGEPENRTGLELLPDPVAAPDFETAAVLPRLCNLERFLESITPSVPSQYLSKTTMRGWRTCDAEFQPYFVLGDLWESFKEWSAYGAGVPLILNDSDSVVQYYVPYLSGIQLYVESMKTFVKSSRSVDDSDSDFRDSSSEGSSDCEPERGMKCSREARNHLEVISEFPLQMDRLSLRDQHVAHPEDCSSDEDESINSQGCLLFEYLERDLPYSREPLADKISDLALHFPELKLLRSCDLLSSSWISVAWYPIYRIPTGPTLKDLDACFLTYHYLHTPLAGVRGAQVPVVTYPSEMNGVPKISLPVFGLASYKFKGSLWTHDGGSEHQRANSLLQAADIWLRLRQVNHPDFLFFCRR